MNIEDQWFLDNSSWRKFISSFKALQDGRTLKKGTKTSKFALYALPDVPMHLCSLFHAPCACVTGWECCLLVFQSILVENPSFHLLAPK